MRLLAALSLIMLLAVLVPKGIEAQETGVLVIPTVDTFNLPLHYSSDGNAGGLLSITSEPLIQLDSDNGRFVPWLANSVTTNDGGKTWRISLHEDVLWSDGEPLDTSDIAFTFDLILTSTTFVAPIAVELRARVESVTAVDDQEFLITLRKADMRFPHSFLTARREGTFFVIPEHVWDGKIATFASATVGAGLLEPLLGSGPYVAESITAAEATFVRNEDWWGAKAGFRELPSPEKIIVRYFESDEDVVEALKADEIDIGQEVSLATFGDIRAANPKATAWNEADPIPWPSQCPRQLDFNTIVAPWNDARLRRAVAHYIDQSEVVATVFDGQNYPSPTMFSAQPGLAPYVQAIMATGHSMSPSADSAAGDVLLAEAGYTKGADGFFERSGDDLTLTIHVANEPARDAEVARAIGDMLTAAGIQTTVNVVPGDELWAWIMPPGEFEAVYSWLSCASMVDPFASLLRYHPKFAVDLKTRSPGYQNMARWNTNAAVAYGALVDQIEAFAPGDPAITDLVIEAYGHLAREMPFIPIVQDPVIIPVNTSRWTGWPSVANPYALPKTYWGQFQSIVHQLEQVDK